MMVATQPVVSDGPAYVVVQCAGQPQAEGVYVNSAQYRGHAVWTADGGALGNRILFTALDGRWYVGGDGSEEQGWVRSATPHHGTLPGNIPHWELRQGSEWHHDPFTKVLSTSSTSAHLKLHFPCSPQANGWFEQITETSWVNGAFSIASRNGHWCVSHGSNVIAATMEPHQGVPSGSSEWVALGEKQTQRSDELLSAAAGYRQEAAALLERADEAERRAQELLQEEAVAQRSLLPPEERKRDAARDVAAALDNAQQALSAAERVRASTPTLCITNAPNESTSPPRPAEYDNPNPEDRRKQEARDNALYAARAAEHAAEHARRLRDQSRAATPPPDASAGGAPAATALAPYVPSPPRGGGGGGVEAAFPSVRVYVPGVPILCGTYRPHPKNPRTLVYNDFKMYDNNGYWAVGTEEDIKNGVGWLASIQKHHGKPAHHNTLEWRKWVGHSWEGDAGITVTEHIL